MREGPRPGIRASRSPARDPHARAARPAPDSRAGGSPLELDQVRRQATGRPGVPVVSGQKPTFSSAAWTPGRVTHCLPLAQGVGRRPGRSDRRNCVLGILPGALGRLWHRCLPTEGEGRHADPVAGDRPIDRRAGDGEQLLQLADGVLFRLV